MLNRNYLNVPIGVRYISDWKELDLPKGHYILNKIVTGCGFTEYFLNNNIPTILCSPRKVLLENKYKQHLIKGRLTYLYRNKYDLEENVDSSIQEKLIEISKIEDKNDILQYNRDLQNYIYQCTSSINIIPKILVTYDSLKHVLESINEIDPNLINQFQIVVDEFQSIFSDSAFKASTELNFVDYLQNVPNVCYLSATPVLDKYLEQLDEFKDLPYYELVWDSSMIAHPKLDWVKMRSIPEACYNIIQEYKNGIYPRKYYNNQIIESKEVVFYINSVTDICKIIKKADLKDYEVNVICAHDSKNLKKLKKVGINNYGTVPLEGDPHKMFTFCTRTVYLGADFYSTCASTVICSDCNLSNMSLDISLDLPQIVGRQRLEENIFRYDVKFFFKISGKDFTKEQFDLLIKEKRAATLDILSTYSKMDEIGKKRHNNIYRTCILAKKYKEDYVSISEKTGTAVYNKLVELHERRAWEIQQLNYKDEVAVLKSLQEEGYDNIQEYVGESKNLILEFISEFEIDKNFERRMRLYCTFLDQFPTLLSLLVKVPNIPSTFHMYYELLGHKGIRAKEYKEIFLKSEVDIIAQNPKVREYIIINFIPGNKYTNKFIKQKLQEIYNQLEIKKTAKATDIDNYLILKKIKIQNPQTGKRDEGFEIIGLK